jgi:hypothetical protein
VGLIIFLTGYYITCDVVGRLLCILFVVHYRILQVFPDQLCLKRSCELLKGD